MIVFLRSSLFEPIREPSLWTRLYKAEERPSSYARRLGPEEGTRRVVAKPLEISPAERKKERTPTVDVPHQKIAAPVSSHLEKVSTPHHQAAAAQAIMKMGVHEYHRTGDVRHILRAQRAQQHLNRFAAQGIVPTAQHHADWVDHYAEHGDKYSKSPVSAMTRARWHKIAGGIEYSGFEHEHKPEWTEAQAEAHIAKLRPREEPLPASDLPFTRPPRVSPPKVKETIGYTRKIIPYQKSLFNLLLMKACSLDLWKAKTPEQLVQHGYARAHDRIRETIKYGGDHRAATRARIAATSDPHKLVGIYHAAKDYKMHGIATEANARLKELHGHTVRSYPHPPERIKPHTGKKGTAPTYPKKPKKGESAEDYHKRVFTHFRIMGKPHTQAHAIAFRLREKHFNKAVPMPEHEFRQKVDEAKKKHKKIEAEYQASKKPSPSLPPMGGESLADIHTRAAHHIVAAHHHHQRGLELSEGGDPTAWNKHWDKFVHHYDAAADLLKRGAKPGRSHFNKIRNHYENVAHRATMGATGPRESDPAHYKAEHAIGMSEAAHDFNSGQVRSFMNAWRTTADHVRNWSRSISSWLS